MGVAVTLKLIGVDDGFQTRYLRSHNPVVCLASYCNFLEIWGVHYCRSNATNCNASDHYPHYAESMKRFAFCERRRN